jgi:ribonuclease HI
VKDNKQMKKTNLQKIDKFHNEVSRLRPDFIVFTDGAVRKKEGIGGASVFVADCRVLNKKPIVIDIGYFIKNNCTSQRAELTAFVIGLVVMSNLLKISSNTILFSDSKYCVEGCTKWVNSWSEKNIIFSKKNPEFWDFINKFTKLRFSGVNILRNIRHCYGHTDTSDDWGIVGNYIADAIATKTVESKKTYFNCPISILADTDSLEIFFEKLNNNS